MRELSVTYLILACGEEQVFELINFIKNHKDHEDKIMVLYDCTTSRPEFEKKLKQQSVKIVNHVLGLDYAAHRNAALEHIKTDYVFAIDADEVPHTDILEKGLLKKII
jgi:cellulose synthase/poly-beta-1,6-N-acetylglucosamine synthase-like glycosyltransferase